MDLQIAKEKAIKYVFVSKKTEYEVRNRLKKYRFDEDVIEKVIISLKENKYIDDNDYIDAYLRQSMRLLNYSLYEIKQKLLQKGLKKDIIEKKLTKLKDLNYENKVVEKLLLTKCKLMDDLKQKQYLYRRGFVKIYIED